MITPNNTLKLTPEFIFVHRFDLERSGSFQMRAVSFFESLRRQGFKPRSISEADRSLRSYEGKVILFIKPLRPLLPYQLSKTNLVIVDPLDDAHILPAIELPFHFIFSSRTATCHYSKRFKAKSVKTLYHHFDARIKTKRNSNFDPGIAYVGDPIKLDIKAKSALDITSYSFSDFLQGHASQRFHWTVKPHKYQFEPLTKTVTALAAGAIPIINSNELGEILPKNYPLHITSELCERDLIVLKEKIQNPQVIQLAENQIQSIDISDYSADVQARRLALFMKEFSEMPSLKRSFRIASRIALQELLIILKQGKNRLAVKLMRSTKRRYHRSTPTTKAGRKI